MKSTELLKLTSSLLFAVMIASGCRCGPPPLGNTEAEFAVSPPALNFEACPTKDENGVIVPEVFPDEQIFKLENLGKVSGTVSKLTITSDVDGAFTIADDKKPTVVGGSESVEVPVRFSPTKKGDIRGKITIEDESPDTENVVVDLIGTGKNLPAQPLVQLQFEATPGGSFLDCDPSVVANCSPVFPDTFYNETSELVFKVKNGGCPTLKITGIELKAQSAQTAVQQAYSFESGFVIPTPQNPATLNAADDNSELRFKVRFAPVDESPVNADPQRYAILTLTTNDPNFPSFDVGLFGNGNKPSAYASPTFCNFTPPPGADGGVLEDKCGQTTRIPGKARIAIGNQGLNPIKVKALSFANGGRAGRFTLTGPSAIGVSFPAGGFAYQEVTFQDLPLFVSDELTIQTIDAAANPEVPAGDVKVTFYGGTLPCLSTAPGDQLSFENPTADLTVKDVVIRNGLGCGTLVYESAAVDAPNTFYRVSDQPANGTAVNAGSQITIKVEFKKPVSGGSQTGVLRIKTNDPAYGPEPYKVITLYSQAPVNQLPQAVLKGPDGKENTYTVSRASVTPTGNPATRKIQVVGTDSFDPPGGAGSVAQYQFQLVLKPSGATGASLQNNGTKVALGTSLLTIDETVVGEYRIALKVFDAQNQPSSNTAVLKVFVTP